MTTSITVTEEEASQLQAMGFEFHHRVIQGKPASYCRRYTPGSWSYACDIDYNMGALADSRYPEPFLAIGAEKTGFDNIISAAAWLLLQGKQP